jgi:hypothetical protein
MVMQICLAMWLGDTLKEIPPGLRRGGGGKAHGGDLTVSSLRIFASPILGDWDPEYV